MEKEKEFDHIISYLFWGGFMSKSEKETNAYIFKQLELDKYCTDKVCNFYKERNKHVDFFKKYKDDEEFKKYVAWRLSEFCYNELANKQ